MDNKLFSIVTPVYNGEKYLQDTLDSIRRQTFKDFELIVVDGGSSDNTMEIINLNSDLITKTVSEPDNGMYDALEKGFKLATGKYLCYINSDDRLLPHALEFVKSKMKEGKYDLVFGDVNYLSEQGDIVYTHKALLMPKYGVKYMRRLPFAQQSAFWTRDLYNRIGGFDSSLKFVADSEFLLKAYLNPTVKVGYIDSVLGEFRMHGSSFTIGSSSKMQLESEGMRNKLGLLGNNRALKLMFEFFIKINNIKGVYQKMKYKGTKF